MSWNEPGGGGRNDDPWGGGRGSGDQGPPDLDEAFRKVQRQLGRIFGRGGDSGDSGGGGGGPGWTVVGLALGGVVIIYLLSGIYTLDAQERGVVLRFGDLRENVAMPGLRWRPRFVDEVVPVNVTRVYSKDHQAQMLTQDQNIVEVSLTVQYVIERPKHFVVQVRDPRESLKQATESALRQVVGSSSMDSVISEGRAQLAIDVQKRLQRYMDIYGTGLQVRTVNIDRAAPPDEVQAAFDDVQKAQEDEERFVNEAKAYAEAVIPKARGQAQQTIEQANAYRDQVIAQAEGETERFLKVFEEYRRAEEVTRDRLYIDAIESVLSKSSKVLVDVPGGNNLMYLPLDKMMSGGGAASGSRTLSESAIQDITDAVVGKMNQHSNSANSSRRRSR